MTIKTTVTQTDSTGDQRGDIKRLNQFYEDVIRGPAEGYTSVSINVTNK